jgi:hypothetical protein
VIAIDLLSWIYIRGGRHRSIYYLSFTVEVGDNDYFIILILQ